MGWLDLLPKTKAVMSVDKHVRVEGILSHSTEVDVSFEGFCLADWDDYLAENHEMFAPYTYTDADDNEFNVVAIQVFFDGHTVKQYLHLTTMSGEQAGMVIFEGNKDDGKGTEEEKQEVQSEEASCPADAVRH